MLQIIKKLTLVLATALSMSVPAMLAPAVVSAQANIQGSLCHGANDLTINNATTPCNSIGNGAGGESRLNTLLTQIINIFSVVVGVVAVIMIIIGGFRYITSGGSSEKVTSAKNTILYALIGLVIVALAQVVVKFVLNRAAG